MKRVRLWATGIGLVICMGIAAVEQGYAGDNDGAPKCTLAMLKGRYLFASNSTANAYARGSGGSTCCGECTPALLRA